MLEKGENKLKNKVLILVAILIAFIIGIIFIINRVNSIKVIEEGGKVHYAKEGDIISLSNCNIEIISIEETQINVNINGNIKKCNYGEEIPIYLNNSNKSTGMYITSFYPTEIITFEK